MEDGSCEVISYTPEIIELEKYLLNFILKWKLVYTTPFDYIQVLVNHSYSKKQANLILSKAIRISELFIICIILI